MTTIQNKLNIPNQLNIIINTSIPGYQKIQYKPYMTIPDISKDDKTIQFNPMIKYNKVKIDSVPENLRKKQFFNKGLFQSLINYINEPEAKTLLHATSNGYVDNNIKDTLNAIFPENSVLYINKEPYSIADVQWTSGDWRIDTKVKKEQFDSSKITNPYLYQTVVTDEIISGEKQLESLPSALVYGENYIGPKNNTGLGINLPPAHIPQYKPPVVRQEIPKPPIAVTSSIPKPKPPLVVTPLAPIPIPKPPQVIRPEPLRIQDRPEPLRIQDRTEPLRIQDRPEVPKIQDIKIEDEKPALQIAVEPLEPLKTSKTSSKLREVFFENKFYDLINKIYISSDKEHKNIIQKSLLNTSSINIDPDATKLSKKAYTQSIQGLKTIENEGKGNCFFIAVADGINHYNYNNQENRIISGNKGTGNNLYTQSYLRSIVSTYIQNWEGLDEFLAIPAKAKASELNSKFVEQINATKQALIENGEPDDISSDNYLMIANDIFNGNDNFLVKNIERIPINLDDYETPFRVLEKSEINRYILSSNFWANEIAIQALSSHLKLNIISLENKFNIKDELTIGIPFGNLSGTVIWDKYLFLYYSQSHYELISFTETKKIPKKGPLGNVLGIKTINKTKIIFNNNDDISELPPIYILFTIFGSYYSILDNEGKKKFTFKKNIMKAIENIIELKLYYELDYTIFYNNFKRYFTRSKIPTPDISNVPVRDRRLLPPPPPMPSQNVYLNSGGALYNSAYPAYKMIKKEENKDDSQIAYYITIDMELKPGTSLTTEELKDAKCNTKWNSIRKAYSKLVGKPYVIPPVYTNTKTLKNKEENKTGNLNPYYKNGGNKNKTRKML